MAEIKNKKKEKYGDINKFYKNCGSLKIRTAPDTLAVILKAYEKGKGNEAGSTM